ncbi:ABC transporter ATP-binding protein [Paenibacillus xylanilyticus]|uniref:ABC transporter ATP-binding protein n=1 Tax=Paenibacillus xylanilyticus TaxID=248903 RepID=A0A7Y6ERZ1_9BACL|nr:ABC transporter ATP-binding protein [Paenibacillus xylanilyticus]NUU74407.1 ABC transporter ATP-binding protein [Paenibacillus xylanilyticus]
MNLNSTIIQLEQVNKQFGSKLAVNNISLKIDRGSIVAILGPNGAGKTTTIKMMLGLSRPSSGKVTVLGMPPDHKQVRERIGVMLQDVSVMDGLTVREMIRLVRSYYPAPLDADQIEALTGLEPADLNKRAEKLSGGQKRSLNFALAMAGDPDVLFFDEPTVGLDSETRRYFWAQIRQLAEQGKTVLFTTHYLQEADEAADRIILFNGGSIVADGTPDSIKGGIAKRTLSFSFSDDLSEAGSEPNKDLRSGILAQIEELPGVDRMEYRKNRCVLHTENTDSLIRLIITRQLPVREFRIETGQLDDAYATLLETMKEEH